MSIPRIVGQAILALSLFTVVGCQTSTPQPSSELPRQAILVTGVNGGSTTIFIPSSDKKSVVCMSSSKDAAVCPQCRADAYTYFETGNLIPKCPTCGATRVVVNSDEK